MIIGSFSETVFTEVVAVVRIESERVLVDFAGPFQGKMWLLLYDTYSKWGEVINMNNDTTAQATVRAMRRVFCSNGLPWIIVSDNGPQFVSEVSVIFEKESC